MVHLAAGGPPTRRGSGTESVYVSVVGVGWALVDVRSVPC